MSETIAPETDFPSLSEASENDTRDDIRDQLVADGVIEPDAEAPPPEAPQEPAPAEEAPEEESEEDLKARNARLARSLREERRRARQAEEHAQALAGQRQENKDEAFEREVAMRAQQLAQQQAITARANEIYADGCKAFGTGHFDADVREMNEAFRDKTPIVIDALTELANPAQVIHYLAQNPDKAEDLAALPPHRLGAALAREAQRLATPKAKPVSKAPPPVQPLATRSTAEPELDLEKMSMEQLAAVWDKRDWEKRFR